MTNEAAAARIKEEILANAEKLVIERARQDRELRRRVLTALMFDDEKGESKDERRSIR